MSNSRLTPTAYLILGLLAREGPSTPYALERHVAATLGDMHVDCSRIELKYDEAPKVRWAKGSGGVVAKLKGIEATAAQFEVDVAHRSIKLTGGVKLSRGRGWVTADSAAIDINTRKVTLEDVKGSIPVQAPER